MRLVMKLTIVVCIYTPYKLSQFGRDSEFWQNIFVAAIAFGIATAIVAMVWPKTEDQGAAGLTAVSQNRSLSSIYLTTSILITLVLHFLAWQAMSHMMIRPFDDDTEEARKKRRVQVTPVDIRELMKIKPPRPRDIQRRLYKEQEHRLEKLFKDENLIEKPKPRFNAKLTGLGKDELKKEPSTESRYKGPITSPPPEILSIRAATVPIDRRLNKRRTIPDIKRFSLKYPLAPSLVSPNPGGGVDRESIELGMRMTRPKVPLTTFLAPDTRQLPLPPIHDMHRTVTPTAGVNIMDSELDVHVSAHRDSEEGGGFFKVVIKTKSNSEALESIPRDVLFLVDSSASITQQKLKRFKRGLDRALDSIGADDRFNVVAFRDNPIPLFPGVVPATEDAIIEARRFLSKLRSAGKTDVYAGLAPFVDVQRRDAHRPYLIFLITDGQSTTGSKLADNIFIQRIIQRNRAQASVFSFSVGEKSNLFLMDLLSYKNRGRSLHTDDLRGSDTELADYIGGLSEVLVSDLRCRITGELLEDVYPRELPHLFRGFPLTVYGRFPDGTSEIGIQIMGFNAAGEKQELIVRQDLNLASAAGDTLPRQWAAQKLYYLVSERTIRNTPEIQASIDELSKRYDMEVPY
jgi:uncharacterized protein YegL